MNVRPIGTPSLVIELTPDEIQRIVNELCTVDRSNTPLLMQLYTVLYGYG